MQRGGGLAVGLALFLIMSGWWLLSRNYHSRTRGEAMYDRRSSMESRIATTVGMIIGVMLILAGIGLAVLVLWPMRFGLI